MNNFITSAKGFLKAITVDKETKEYFIEWTDKLREAAKFKSKTARELIDKHHIDAFLWNPYKEEPIMGKWEICQRHDSYNFLHDEHHKALEWFPAKAMMKKKTDVNFLVTKGITKETYYDSYEDAVNECTIKNLEILKELQTKIENMNQKIDQMAEKAAEEKFFNSGGIENMFGNSPFIEAIKKSYNENQENICEKCNKQKGQYCIDPFMKEIFNKEVRVCLCNDCYHAIAEET